MVLDFSGAGGIFKKFPPGGIPKIPPTLTYSRCLVYTPYSLSCKIQFHSRLKYMTAPKKHQDFFDSVLEGHVPDILLIPFDTNNFEHYKNLLAMVFDVSHSVTIDYMDSGSVLYRVQSGSQPMLSYFQCFSPSLWTLILMLGIMVSIILTSTSKSWSNVFDITWSVLVLMFAKYIQNSIDLKQPLNKLVMTTWLILVMTLSIIFSNFLLDYLIQPIPDLRIDSWTDLYHRNELKILTIPSNSFVTFAETSDTDMAKNFKSRYELIY